MTQNQPTPTISSMIDEITSRVVKTAPWLTGPVIEAIREMNDTRKVARVQEVLDNVMVSLKGFQSDLAELYVKTPDFMRVLSQVVRSVGDEPRGEKRSLYAAFLTDSIVSPLESVENQARMLGILNQLKSDHVRLLQSLMNLPAPQGLHTMSPLQMLRAQIPDIPHDRMQGLLTQLTELGVSTITDWSSGTYGDIEQIRKSLTPLGRRLLRIIDGQPSND